MIGDVCFTVVQYATLRDEIFASHVQWGFVCLAIGFVIGCLPLKEIHGRLIKK
jgi:hypothetical protein